MKTHTQLYSPKLKNEIQLKETHNTVRYSSVETDDLFFYVAGHLYAHNDITLYKDHTWITTLAHTLFTPYIGCTLYCPPPTLFLF